MDEFFANKVRRGATCNGAVGSALQCHQLVAARNNDQGSPRVGDWPCPSQHRQFRTSLRPSAQPQESATVQKTLHLNPEKCTGCLQCEMACSFENYATYAPAKSRIKVFDFHHTGRKVPYTCTQCDEAWCLHACPVEAITVDKATGAKVVNETTCVGCKVCTISCPFGTINYVQETGKVQKCDLCGGEPACAEACPTGAITYVDANWTGLGKMQAWADKLGNQPAA
jgi:anaerobic carbon-monoxide dehydrogenase iron sulfur subunit